MSSVSAQQAYPTLDELLQEALTRIQVNRSELTEAKRRRDLIRAALRREFSTTRTYANGSVAHGDALTPLLDVDLGVVVPDPDHRYGPGLTGPAELKERAAAAVRRELRAEFGDLRVEVAGHKRSVLVRFNDPMRPGWEDFTADVIVSVAHPSGQGLYIPKHDTWDRSDPEKHTALVSEAIDNTKVSYARIVRLLKHWLRQFEEPPMCSWHVKALALDCITEPTTLLDGLATWFTYAAAQLRLRDTPDPAGVGPDIKTINPSRQAAAFQLQQAANQLAEAVRLEAQGWPALAHDVLAELFGDEEMLPHPSPRAVMAEQAGLTARREQERRAAQVRPAAPAVVLPAVRSWRP